MKYFKGLAYLFYKIILYGLMAISLAILFRIFVGEFYKVPSASMENAIMTNDVIWVDKLAYGANLPRNLSEVPFIGGLFGKPFFPKKCKKISVPGYKKVARNDIVVFATPEQNEEKMLVKRCIGLPGETIRIESDKVYIDGVVQKEFDTYHFDFFTKQDIISVNLTLKKLAVHYNFTKDSIGLLHFYLTVSEAKQLKNSGINLFQYNYLNKFPSVFPSVKNKKWNYQNYGPIWIPKKDNRLLLSDSNYAIYKETISKFENEHLIKSGKGTYLMNGKKITTYQFKYSYYFVMGDNRLNALDSRYFGFIPEFLIEGKTGITLFN